MLKMKINVEEENRDRIDKYLVNYLDESRSMIDKMIDVGYVLVNGNVVNAHYMVKVGDSIEVKDGFKIDTDIVAEDIPLDIVYEDDDLAIINKKSGMVVHPGSGNYHGTLVNALMNYTDDLSDMNGEERPGIVHRIDKDTSGLMVVAKNNEAHRKLVDMLSKHEIKREYIALVKGEFMSDTATIDAPIGRDPQNRKKMAVVARNSKQAITHLRVIKRYKGYTLLRLALETGRTHQIRVHLNYIGFPIYNDPLYTGDSTTEFGQFLHSTSIEFDHPITGKHLHFEVGVPEEFQKFLNTLEEK
ncbi:MAG TPA: RluA family pseudouridine synthase [Bacilli bacterium]|nr:RluA family pseudouridine synthase [Bacilli bacterium]HQC84188.1 RluA family pseudouridine synthase [Bacilli bacterium]